MRRRACKAKGQARLGWASRQAGLVKVSAGGCQAVSERSCVHCKGGQPMESEAGAAEYREKAVQADGHTGRPYNSVHRDAKYGGARDEHGSVRRAQGARRQVQLGRADGSTASQGATEAGLAPARKCVPAMKLSTAVAHVGEAGRWQGQEPRPPHHLALPECTAVRRALSASHAGSCCNAAQRASGDSGCCCEAPPAQAGRRRGQGAGMVGDRATELALEPRWAAGR